MLNAVLLVTFNSLCVFTLNQDCKMLNALDLFSLYLVYSTIYIVLYIAGLLSLSLYIILSNFTPLM